MKIIKHSILLLATAVLLSSTPSTATETEPLYCRTVNKFISAVKTEDPETVSDYIVFPIRRPAPIPPITNKQQFIERYHEIFDKNLTSIIVNSDAEKDWSQVGYQGIMLDNGKIWLNNSGKLIAVNIKLETDDRLKKLYTKRLERSIDQEFDYGISNLTFYTSEGKIPDGCFGMLITELNGDNCIAAIFINRASFRGCIRANDPYPGGEEEEVSYTINEALGNHTYRITVCEKVHGSLGKDIDRILVRFVNRDYIVEGKVKKVLSLEKIGEW